MQELLDDAPKAEVYSEDQKRSYNDNWAVLEVLEENKVSGDLFFSPPAPWD